MKTNMEFPLRSFGGKNWLWIDAKGIKRMEVVAYRADLKDGNLSFAGGHRHRHYSFHDSIHIHFPAHELPVDIKDVEPAKSPPVRRHHKR